MFSTLLPILDTSQPPRETSSLISEETFRGGLSQFQTSRPRGAQNPKDSHAPNPPHSSSDLFATLSCACEMNCSTGREPSSPLPRVRTLTASLDSSLSPITST